MFGADTMWAVAAIPFKNPNEVMKKVVEAKDLGADAVELRLDYWLETSLPPFERIASRAKEMGLEVIVTVRNPAEGGEWVPPWREEAYRRANELGLICDVEAKIMKRMPCNRTIASVHYFNYFPAPGDIRVLSEMVKDAWAFKLAVLIKPNEFPEFLKRVQEIIHERKAFMPMGKDTERLRLACAAMGSFLNYGSLGESTAPGQVPLKALVRVLEVSRNLVSEQ